MISLYETILKSVGAGKEAVGIGDWKIGMILSAPYQYSSRHNNYFEIVGVKGKATVIVKALKKEITSHDGYGQNGYDKPVLGQYASDEIKTRINSRGDLVIMGNTAHVWGGKPEPFYTD